MEMISYKERLKSKNNNELNKVIELTVEKANKNAKYEKSKVEGRIAELKLRLEFEYGNEGFCLQDIFNLREKIKSLNYENEQYAQLLKDLFPETAEEKA